MPESILKPIHACHSCGAMIKDSETVCPYCFKSQPETKEEGIQELPPSKPPKADPKPVPDGTNFVTREELRQSFSGLSGGVGLIAGGLAISLFSSLGLMGATDLTYDAIHTATILGLIGSGAALGGVLMVLSWLRTAI